MRLILWAIVVISLIHVHASSDAIPQPEREQLLSQIREMFLHGYNAYLEHAFPADELQPLECKPRIRISDPKTGRGVRGSLDDSIGNYCLTLVDSLSSLALITDAEIFAKAVTLVIDNVEFNADEQISVFEANIRVVGGLISAHMLLSVSPNTTKDYFRGTLLDPNHPNGREYKGELLSLAIKLADRLLVAFNTSTSLPLPRINLARGIVPNIDQQTCTACAGTLLLEFGALSRLTGDTKYMRVARHAIASLWERRSSLNLVGGEIDVQTGRWTGSITSVGAGVDSFIEYLLKGHIVFGHEGLLDMFDVSYAAVKKHMRQWGWHVAVDMHSGSVINFDADSLSAFYPGLMVLYGDINGAAETFSLYASLWRQYGLLPEVYNIAFSRVSGFQPGYPLRPELAESAFMLYQSTGDAQYQYAARDIVNALNTTTRVMCGYATVSDVQTGQLEDRMDSFFLSETLKYLYLTFDDTMESPSLIGRLMREKYDFVFTTEGHPLPLVQSFQGHGSCPLCPLTSTRITGLSHHTMCPANGWRRHGIDGWTSAVRRAGSGQKRWPIRNMCFMNDRRHTPMPTPKFAPKPAPDNGVFSMVVMPGGTKVKLWPSRAEDLHVTIDTAGRVTDMNGNERHGTLIAIAKAAIEGLTLAHDRIAAANQGQHCPTVSIELVGGHVLGTLAGFGPNVGDTGAMGVAMVGDGCTPLSLITTPTIALITRGGCLFIDKVLHAQQANYSAVIIIDHTDGHQSGGIVSEGIKTWWHTHGHAGINGEWPLFNMAGDGTERTNKIEIASMIVTRESGDIIKTADHVVLHTFNECGDEAQCRGKWCDCVGVRVDGIAFKIGDGWFSSDDLKREIGV